VRKLAVTKLTLPSVAVPVEVGFDGKVVCGTGTWIFLQAGISGTRRPVGLVSLVFVESAEWRNGKVLTELGDRRETGADGVSGLGKAFGLC